MEQVTRSWSAVILLVFLLFVPVIAATVPDPDYTITYSITVREDGTALWLVEYRTLLVTPEDLISFENYSRDLSSVHLPEFRDLMQRSAAQAAAATSRQMETGGFSGNAVVQTSPTGSYGVVMYSFNWTGFARADDELIIGDVFAGGMYLAKENTLIVHGPSGYTVKTAEPAPDEVRDGLIWYGQRSFGAGEPRIALEKPSFPVLPLVLGLVIVAGAGAIVIVLITRRRILGEQKDPRVPLSETEIQSVEERIVQLLRVNQGELFQSEIIKNLGLPKSTVSITLNDLHRRGIILKVKKGKENLIRLA